MPEKKVTYEELLGLKKPTGEKEAVRQDENANITSTMEQGNSSQYNPNSVDSKPVGTPVRIPPRSSEHPMGLLRGIHWVLFHKDPPHLRGIGKPEVIDLIIEGLEDLK